MHNDYHAQLRATQHYWDNTAATFDHEPDHGLRDPLVRQAWADLLTEWLPATASTILDIGCGTGSLTLLMSQMGHGVTGIDLSPAMIAQAQQKAQTAGQSINFQVMEATDPHLGPLTFDVILCRHLLWALPAPAHVLARWSDRLQPGGRLLLIEGCWHTGGGLHVEAVVAALPAGLTAVTVIELSAQPLLWGGPVTDERYLVVASASSLST